MHVRHLSARNFRNYATVELTLDRGITVFEGANGQGKTNLVEAIAYLGTLKSHRVSTDAALVKFGETAAMVRAQLQYGSRSLTIDVDIAKSGSNRPRVRGHAVLARELPRFFTTVVFAPEDLSLVRGDPAQRREFLDSLLITHSPRFASTLSSYDRVLKQRNSLLKTARAQGRSADLNTLEFWDEQLISHGSRIIAARLSLVERLRMHVAGAYTTLVAADHAAGATMRVSALQTTQTADTETRETLTEEEIAKRFQRQLTDARERELDRAVTLVGPHRDDVTFWLNALPARTTASHGESWSFALSLKLAAAQLIRSESKTGDPVLILDDVFAELDATRRTRLADAVRDFEQVLITCAVLTDIPEELRERTVRIENGTVRQTGKAPPAEPLTSPPEVLDDRTE